MAPLTQSKLSRLEEKLIEADYAETMGTFAVKAAQRLSRTSAPASAFHIVSSVEDFDLLAIPVLNELEHLGHSGVWTCLWPDRTVIGNSRKTENVSIVVSVDGAPIDTRKHLVFVSSCVDTSEALEAMVIHALYPRDFVLGGISVIAPFFSRGTKKGFAQALPRRDAGTFRWLGFFQLPPELANRLKDTFMSKTALALGVEDWNSVRRYMPKQILARY